MSGNVAESDFSTWMLLQGDMWSSCQAQGANVLQKNKNIAKTIQDSQLSASNFLLAAFRPLRWSPETLCSSPEPAGPGRWKKVRCSHRLTVLFNHGVSATHTFVSLSPQTTWPRSWSFWVKSHQMWPFPAGTLPSTSTAEVGGTETSNPREIPVSQDPTCTQVTCAGLARSDSGACTTSSWRNTTSCWRRPPPSRTSCSGCWITVQSGGPQRPRASATPG